MHLESGGLRNGLPVLCDGSGRLDRNLSTAEIVDQVREAAAAMRDGEVAGGPGRLSNVVFMGMGEPLANYKRVVAAVRRITSPAPTASACLSGPSRSRPSASLPRSASSLTKA